MENDVTYTGKIECDKDKIVQSKDLNKMSKDELLDYSVELKLDKEITYDMTKKEIINIIRKHLEGEK